MAVTDKQKCFVARIRDGHRDMNETVGVYSPPHM